MDRSRVEAFLDKFAGLGAGATTIALLAVADRTGLLTWLGSHGGGTAEEISKGAGLDTRYVTEICSGLAAAGVLDHESGVFTLPEEHAVLLSDESNPYFMGGWLDMIPAMYGQIDAVANATKHGGGVAFDAFGEGMFRGLDRANAPSQRILLTRKWIPAVPGLVEKLEAGIRIADVGCGSGTAALAMARAFPSSTVVGYDSSPEMIAMARKRADGLDNLRFELRSVEDLPTEPGFDLITTFDVIHDLVDPLGGLTRIRLALADGGMYLMMEPNMSSEVDDNINDVGAINYGTSAMFCMTQSLAKGGAGLGAGWGRQAAETLAAEAGFGSFQEVEPIRNRFSSFYLLSD
jgi:SAM-dependent methyltransferase